MKILEIGAGLHAFCWSRALHFVHLHEVLWRGHGRALRVEGFFVSLKK